MLVGVFSALIVESFIIIILQCNSHLIFLQAMYLRTALIEEYFFIIALLFLFVRKRRLRAFTLHYILLKSVRVPFCAN